MIVPSEPPRRTIRRLRLASVKLGRSRTENEWAFCKSNRFVTVQPVHRRRFHSNLVTEPSVDGIPRGLAETLGDASGLPAQQIRILEIPASSSNRAMSTSSALSE